MSTFDRWELAARTALSERGVGYHDATPLIRDARAHVEGEGRDPWEVLGPPEQFAADVAVDRPSVRTLGDHLSDAAFVLAVLAIPAVLAGAWAAGSMSLPVTVAGLVGTAGVAAAVLTGYGAGGALRSAGRPRAAIMAYACGVLLVVAAAAAFTGLPRTRLTTVPVLAVVAVALLACWLLTRPGRARAATDETGPADTEAWFARLDGLLVGRFDVPRRRSAELVAQARAHVAASGTAPREEFGPAARYARELAAAEPARGRGRLTAVLDVAAPVLLLAMAVSAAVDGNWWLAAMGAWLSAWTVMSARRRRTPTPADPLTDGKANDARSAGH